MVSSCPKVGQPSQNWEKNNFFFSFPHIYCVGHKNEKPLGMSSLSEGPTEILVFPLKLELRWTIVDKTHTVLSLTAVFKKSVFQPTTGPADNIRVGHSFQSNRNGVKGVYHLPGQSFFKSLERQSPKRPIKILKIYFKFIS